MAYTAIDSDSNTKPLKYLKNALVGGALGIASGYLGGNGTATKHMQSAFKTALHNGNWHYYFTQTTTESIRAGIRSIKGITRGTIPNISRFIYKCLRGEVLVE